jgi:hypothetical protein
MNRKLGNRIRGNELFKGIGNCSVSVVVRNGVVRGEGRWGLLGERRDSTLQVIHVEKKIKNSTSKRVIWN